MHCTSLDIAVSGSNISEWININRSSLRLDDLERSSPTSLGDLQNVAMVKFIAYSIVFPVIIVLGVIGNVINLIVLTRPSLKGVTFVYLSWLAISDLAVLLMGSISMMRLAGIHPRDYSSAFFFAHLEMPLVNAFMASSVFLVVAVTIDRYWSVCLPTRYADIHNERQARVAITMSFVFAFILYIPVAFQKYPVPIVTESDAMNATESLVEFHACEWSEVSTHPAFKLYLLIKEVAVRMGPAIVVVILNTCIIVTFRRLQKKRASLLGSSAEGKRLAEEQRLVILLVAIVIMFLICMTPAAILTVIISDHYENHLPFQIFRAIANNMEMLNFASNFYVYCLCSSEIRRTFFQLFGGFFARKSEQNSHADASLITSKITKISLDATRV
ncbi:7 transmembrane receptor-like [Tropilaelaps mercedesae]|uniref:7 transmembrane receptor-like n=1 Tax=Tropilaelaps mercedesae TaxID=418985 RepID=A0A1V9XQC4_9ACAR|nr:7 transmembrane receptor-like [Tropilaelaps mercedesae]